MVELTYYYDLEDIQEAEKSSNNPYKKHDDMIYYWLN